MDVLFAVLPFADPGMPTIGVSLLKAEIGRHGFSSLIRYFNADFVDRIGIDLYRHVANSFAPESLLGEWFFADAVFDEGLPPEQDYLTRILARFPDGQRLTPDILKARHARNEFLDWCTREIAREQPGVVGFPTTFHQTCACLAVAKRLKQLPSPPVIVFGGANCEGEMGRQLARSFPYIDYVCVQEGERAFPALLQRLLRGRQTPAPGIVSADQVDSPEAPSPIEDLDALPMPDYSDYFERISRASWSSAVDVHLLMETSRGCWWGAKQHCTFCGLNGATMRFRSKSPERAFSEMQHLSETYGVRKVECVDNILDPRYIATLFPRLASSDLDLDLFYEVKANLRLDQLSVLRAGGMRSIQPGIESFSTAVLQLMRKGVSGSQNIQLLRWCEELDINVAWNLLGGFPGEPVEEYTRMARIIPLLVHLQPPTSCGKFRLDRFSPHFTHPETLGVKGIRPMPAYYYVFPLGRRDLFRLAYYFDFDHADGRDPDTYIGRVGQAVEKWWSCRAPGQPANVRLDAVEHDGALLITDTRPCAVAREHRLEQLSSRLYNLCDSGQKLETLVRKSGASEATVQASVQELTAKNLMVELDHQYLSLAVLRNRPGIVAPQETNARTQTWIQIRETPAAGSLLPAV
jgi:ribosomal peptide maturation radical SAM protein 1